MNFFHFILLFIFSGVALPRLTAVEVRIATYNVLTGIGATNETGRTAVEAVLGRINADILCLQEVTGADIANGHLDDMASNLGYDYVFVPSTALDSNSRVIILSTFPFVADTTKSIISPPGANDMTRAAAAAIVDVPGTINDPIIVTAHLKCCFDMDDPFRRAIEMQRIRNYLNDLGVDGSDNVFVMGDFNLLGGNQTFTMLPEELPASYQLGTDITFNVNYYSDPTRYFPGLGLVNPGYRQQDGFTTDTFMGSDTILDHLLVSTSVADRLPSTEIYNSLLEDSFPGLPKSGSPLAAVTSSDASDHYPVFGDFDLDGGLPLDITVTPAFLDEDSLPATVTVTLPTPAAEAITLTLQSSDPNEATLADAILLIPAGASIATTTLNPRLDKISDGTRSIDILVSGTGYQGAMATVNVRDADPRIYVLENFTESLNEDFEGFGGTQSLAAWRDGGIQWLGIDDGSSSQFGGRSYQGSLGILTSESVTFQATLRNATGQIIPALEMSYLAQHWRRIIDGSADRIEVSLLRNGVSIRLPELDFEPSTLGIAGQLSPPEQSQKSTYLRNLNFAPGEEIEVLFQVIPGIPGGTISDDVFINEFHYDNGGIDVGEFIEVFVGAGFSGSLSDITLHLYNGNTGSTYGGVQSLASFVEGPSNGPDGPRIFYKPIAGIQNGSPDGIALALDGVVREFLSYEGIFTAADGIAAGIVADPIGVSQNGGTPAGVNSIARSGTGGRAEDFVWKIQPSPHSPGEINVGQTIGASPKPQGIAIDHLRITPLADSDGDLLPDQEESALGTNPFVADSDHDGQSDFFETILTETDPLSGSSFFETNLIIETDLARVTFPSLIDRSYRVETSNDLANWISSSEQAGTDGNLSFELDRSNTLFFRVRISHP